MADTRTTGGEGICADCGKPADYVHWGPLTDGEVKALCVICINKRSKKLNGEEDE